MCYTLGQYKYLIKWPIIAQPQNERTHGQRGHFNHTFTENTIPVIPMAMPNESAHTLPKEKCE